MLIPAFNHNHVLPPHLGNPTSPEALSPYKVSIIDFSKKFSTSNKRIQLLKGFIAFRQKMNFYKIINGFQWINGSFTENIEMSEKRDPKDIDVVTFYSQLSFETFGNIINNFQEFLNPILSKNNFSTDHYSVDYAYSPETTIFHTKYWVQLFTHNRNNVWKGIIQLPLNTPDEDLIALDYINSLNVQL